MLPRILSTIAPCFSLQNCNFAMEKSKEATARIVGFKELGITHCFTMESTYSGMDQGLYKVNVSLFAIRDFQWEQPTGKMISVISTGLHICHKIIKSHKIW